MILVAAKQHFDEDIERARRMLAHARGLPEGVLRDDILRSAWMMGVGACDAYFSDAYADLIARTLKAKDIEPAVDLPDRLNDLKVPVIAVIREAGSWRWRMAARELIEDQSVLSLEKIKKLFNHFFRQTHKLLTINTIEEWITHAEARTRHFGIGAAPYRRLNQGDKARSKSTAIEHFEELLEGIFQRRHDCIHNCDRPRMALQVIRDQTVEKRIYDMSFLVARCQEAFRAEFPEYLRGLGFSGVTRNRVGV